MRTHATTAEHLALAPPSQGQWAMPAGLAVGVHTLLVVALAWGVSWKDTEPVAIEAELWSRLPQEAAPKPVAAEPPPPPPEPQVEKQAPPPPQASSAEEDAQIAVRRREQQQRQQEEARRLEQDHKAKLAKEAKERDAKAKADKARADAEKKQQDARLKAEAEKKKQAEAAQRERTEARLADARKKAEQAAIDKNREEQIKRQLAQLGGATGSGGSGQAAKSSGPSAGYAGRVAARIRPNIRFDDDLPDNPTVEVGVRTLPDATIISRTPHKSSGNAGWDQAALRAIDRTATLPRDTDGRVPADLIIELRPRDQ